MRSITHIDYFLLSNSNNMEEKNKQPEGQKRTYHCNDCGNTIYRHEVFCSKCGKQLDHFDFED